MAKSVSETAAAAAKVGVLSGLSALPGKPAYTLQDTARQLNVTEMSQEEEIASALREMPQLDFGKEAYSFKHSPFVWIAPALVKAWMERRLKHIFGPGLSEAFRSYRRSLDAWVRRAAGPDPYSISFARRCLSGANGTAFLGAYEVNPETAEALRRDVADIQVKQRNEGELLS